MTVLSITPFKVIWNETMKRSAVVLLAAIMILLSPGLPFYEAWGVDHVKSSGGAHDSGGHNISLGAGLSHVPAIATPLIGDTALNELPFGDGIAKSGLPIYCRNSSGR